MTPRLEHIGVAVRDAAPVATLYEALFGYVPYKREAVEAEGVRTIFVSAGSVKLELLEATGEGTAIGRFLERRGEGLHHLAFEVDDAAATMARLRERGFEPLSDTPSPGADGKRIFFLHPRQTHGVLVEFCESVASPFAALDPVRASASTAYRVAGPAAAPALLMLADAREDPTHDAPVLADALAEHFRVILPLTENPPDWRRTLNESLNHAGVERSVLLTLGGAASAVSALPDLLSERCSGWVAAFPAREIDDPSGLPGLPILVVGGSRRLEAALAWHRSLPGSGFLALPHAGLADADASTRRWLADQIRVRLR